MLFLLFGLINLPRTQTKPARTQNAPVYIQHVSLLFPAKGHSRINPYMRGGVISLFKKLDIKIISSLAVSDTGTLNSDPFKFLPVPDKYLTLAHVRGHMYKYFLIKISLI